MSREEETERLRSLLCLAVGLLHADPRAVERRLGATPRFLNRLFNDFIEFRVQHLFTVLEAIELEPSEFFELAYPSLPATASPAAVLLRRRLAEISPEERKEAIERAGHPTRRASTSEPRPRGARASAFVRGVYEPTVPPPPSLPPPPPPSAPAVPDEPPSGDRLAEAMERILRQILSEETVEAPS